MSTIKTLILGVLFTVLAIGTANASSSVKKLTQADATAYAKIDQIILEAERKTGTSADLITAIAFMESNFDGKAINKTSKVKGVLQYSKRQWAGDLKLHANKLGLSAKSSVRDTRANILIGAAGLAGNRKYLERKLKRQVNDSEVYMSWRVGLYGAERILKAKGNQPITAVLRMHPGNGGLYSYNGRVYTVAQFKSKMAYAVKAHKKQVSRLVNQSKLDQFVNNLRKDDNVNYRTAMLH